MSGISHAATQYTLDTDPNLEHDNGGNFAGWQASLKDSYLVQNGTTSTIDWDGVSSVTLTSITITNRNQSVEKKESVLAIYQVEGNDRFGSYIGLSTNAMSNFQNGGTNTLTFDNLTLDPSQTYAFVFLTGTTTAEQAALITDANFVNYSNWFQVQVSYPTSMPSGSGTISKTSLNTGYIPTVSYNFTVSSPAVPEPATATLSLLALAGLAARRRRK